MMQMNKNRVLFLCTHNSIRSQMAEGLLNTIYGTRFEGFSAGTQPTEVSPYAVEVMKEIGIDITSHQSKSINAFHGKEFDLVVTVCDSAQETCPFYPGKKVIHKSFQDPLIENKSIEDILDTFRKLRDEIKIWIETDLVKEITD